MQEIKFGTDGWRDIIAAGFTFANVRAVAQGIAGFVRNHALERRGIVVGYDNRFLSPQFAEAVAGVLAGNGIRVFMPFTSLPTPVVAFAVRHCQAGGAVMITASHNPPEYNGIKFIPEYAGPALPDITSEIEEEIRRVLNGARIYELSAPESDQLGLIEKLDIKEHYIEHLGSLVNLNAFTGHRLRVAVDPMWGAGIGYLEEILRRAGCEVITLHSRRDPLFGGGLPEPTGHALVELMDKVRERGLDLGLALDGDADRFGVVDEDGRFVPPNRVLYLLLDYLLQTRSFRGPVARTLATTHMLDKAAEAYGLKVIETPVGFKYIGQCLREQGCIMGGEESGGMAIQGHVPEKDGILACLLVAEMVSARGKSLKAFTEEFSRKYGRVESGRLDVRYSERDREALMKRLDEFRPRQLDGRRVDRISETEGKKIILEDGNWALIRASGTEPVFRIYAEAEDAGAVSRIQEEIRARLGL